MKKKPIEYLENTHQIATACGVDTMTAKKWVALDEFPAKQKDGWPKLEVLEFGARRMAEHAKQITGHNADIRRTKIEKQVEKLVEDIRKAKADADMAVIERDKASGEVIRVEEHNDKLLRLASLVKNTFEPLPEILAVICRNNDVIEPVRKKIDGLFHVLAQECAKNEV